MTPDSLLSIEELDRLEADLGVCITKEPGEYDCTDQVLRSLSTARLAHRYREAIEKAPHPTQCLKWEMNPVAPGLRFNAENPCNCWKSQALNKET